MSLQCYHDMHIVAATDLILDVFALTRELDEAKCQASHLPEVDTGLQHATGILVRLRRVASVGAVALGTKYLMECEAAVDAFKAYLVPAVFTTRWMR